MTTTFLSEAPSDLEVRVKARELTPRRFLPEHGDVVAIANLARQFTTQATIPYRYQGELRQLRIFPGGWWDSPVQQGAGGEA